MDTSSTHNQTKIKTSAIFIGAIIGIGFWIIIGTLGGAIGMSMEFSDDTVLSNGSLVAIAAAAILVLTSTFFMAGFIASRVAHQQIPFDSVIHSIGAWAVMAILLVILVSGATAANRMRNAIRVFTPPAMITDITVFDAKAVTTMKSTRNTHQPTHEEMVIDKMFKLTWWIAFTSLLFGLGASAAGGVLGRRKISWLG